jgi:hypothetical protein
LEIKTLAIDPVEPGENLFRYTLPVTKKEVLFKFLTGKDQKEITALESFQYGFSKEVTNNVTNFLFSSIVAIDNIKDKNKIKKFVENMPAYDSKSLRTHINKNEPNIIMEHKFRCSNCNENNTTSLPMTINFFWPAF